MATSSLQRAGALTLSTLLVALAALAALTQSWRLAAPFPEMDAPAGEVLFETLTPPPPEPRPPTPRPVVTPGPAPFVAPQAPAAPAPPLIDGAAGAGDTVVAAQPTITRPDWLQRPANLDRFYPARARERGREGVVQLDCVVRVDGRLDCAVASETPANWRFGDAALEIARGHRMVPATRDGVPVEAFYRMRVPFTLR